MKLKIVRHYNKENGHFTGFELKEKTFFFLPWRSLRFYGNKEHEIEHDVVWLMSMHGKVKKTDEYD